MILPIYIYGDSILRKRGIFIEEKSKELDSLIENMFLTLEQSDGVGLAAHQVGKPYKLFIIDYTTSTIESDGLKDVFINPEIIEYSNETEYFEEGCLSVPGIHEEVKRPIKIKMKYLDTNFIEHIEEFSGFLARVIQHEYDHTVGIMFIDKLAPIKKKLIAKKLQLILRRKVPITYKHK